MDVSFQHNTLFTAAIFLTFLLSRQSMEPTISFWFPNEIMMNIMSHLPIKSMVRFRCVCKSWFRLFNGQNSDPYFTQLHDAQITLANPNPILIHLRNVSGLQLPCNFCFASDYNQIDNPMELKEPDWYTDEIPSYWGDEGIRVEVYGICNGLICVKSSRFETNLLYIWNPVTRDNVTVPCPPYLSDKESSNRNKRAVYGFGFCETTNEYKVVGVFVSSLGCHSRKYDYQCHANVYTLGTNTWRTMQDILFDVRIPECKPIVVNGVLHWLSEQKSTYRKMIISFDMTRECLQEILVPKVFINNNYFLIEELSGMLAIVCKDKNKDVQIWVMKDYGVQDSWTKQFSIAQSQIPVQGWPLEPFGTASDGNIMMRNGKMLVLFNPKASTVRTHKFFWLGDSFPTAYFYKWSLVSPRYITVLKPIVETEDSE